MDGGNSLFGLSGFSTRESQLLHLTEKLLNQEAKREANSTKMSCQKATLLLFMQKHEFIQYHSKKDIIYYPCVKSYVMC